MEHEFEKLPPGSKQERIPLFAGVELSYPSRRLTIRPLFFNGLRWWDTAGLDIFIMVEMLRA